LSGKNTDLEDEEWEKIIEEFDKNGDGMINFEEFKKMMLELYQRASLSSNKDNPFPVLFSTTEQFKNFNKT
jgi:hypothetical protein